MPNGRNQQTKGEECKDYAWKCSRCSGLLGYVDMPKLQVVRLKYKDNYVYIGDPLWVRTICRQCAAVNDLCDRKRLEASSGVACVGAIGDLPELPNTPDDLPSVTEV